MVLNHAVGVVIQKWFPGQTDNTSVFVESSFAVDIWSLFRYRYWCFVDFDSDKTFSYVSIEAKSLLEY